MGLSLFIEVAKVLSQWGNYKVCFFVKVGANQGSVLRLLLFIMVMDVLTEDVRDGSLRMVL